MITYKTIVNACNAFADNHHIIKGFGAGELWQINDHDQDSAFEYPLQYMVDVPSSPGPKSWTYAFRVYFVSRVEAPKDRDGSPIYFEYTSEKSAMLSCAQDFLSYWVQDVNYKLTIEQSLGVTTFIDAQEDGVTGCYVDIRFVVPFTYDSCIIPMDGVPAPDSLNVEVYVNDVLRYTLTPSSELLLNVIDTNGDPVDATISGTNIIVPAASVCDPVTMTYNGAAITSTPAGDNKDIFSKDTAGNNVGTKTVDTASELTTVIADHQTELNGTVLVPNKVETNKAMTIRYANNDPVVVTTITDTETVFIGEVPDVVVPVNLATTWQGGQTTSYVSGDAGAEENGAGIDFFTLKENNYFGNTNRFTDKLGGQTYSDAYRLDHSKKNQVSGTIRVWYLGLESDTLSNHLSGNAGAGFTQGGLSGWKLPFFKVLVDIMTEEQPSMPLNYAPFNINANSLANSIALQTTISLTNGTRFANSLGVSAVGYANTMRRIIYRDCTPSEIATL